MGMGVWSFSVTAANVFLIPSSGPSFSIAGSVGRTRGCFDAPAPLGAFFVASGPRLVNPLRTGLLPGFCIPSLPPFLPSLSSGPSCGPRKNEKGPFLLLMRSTEHRRPTVPVCATPGTPGTVVMKP
jgi:hypothetical protein